MVIKRIKRYLIKKYSIGFSTCCLILYKFGFLYNKRYKSIIDEFLIKNIEQNILLYFKKRKSVIKMRSYNIKKKIINGSYFGYKRSRGLPIYGQRTKTNNRTARKKIS